MGFVARLDGFQRRHPAAGLPLAVIYKYADDSGSYLAALITYYAFVSLFPLLLLFTTVLGFVLRGNPSLQQRIEQSTLHQLPVVGTDLGHPHALGGGVLGLVVGGLGALYGGLGVAQASQYAMNTAWGVPRNRRPNPLIGRGRSLVLLSTVGVGVVATTVVSSFGATSVGSLGLGGRVLVIIASLLLNTGVLVLAFVIGTARRLGVRDVLVGAIIAAVGWQALQTFGVAYVTHIVATSRATNSVFALVLGLLGFLYLAATLVVLSVEVNVVRAEHLYPRALLTPFTDAVDLTQGDQDAYSSQAEAQQAKGFETIDVSFESKP